MEQKIAFTKNKKSWINQNIDLLLQHRGEWIAYNSKGLLSFGKDLDEVMSKASTISNKYKVWFVNKHFGEPRALMIKMIRRNIFTIRDESHFWIPEVEITFRNGKNIITQDILIDSGSDFTILPLQTGLKLGFKNLEPEIRKKGYGITGSFSFLIREVTCILHNKKFLLPVAWVQDEEATDLILGREVVFDLFDIEFKQAEETINFKWRGK